MRTRTRSDAGLWADPWVATTHTWQTMTRFESMHDENERLGTRAIRKSPHAKKYAGRPAYGKNLPPHPCQHVRINALSEKFGLAANGWECLVPFPHPLIGMADHALGVVTSTSFDSAVLSWVEEAGKVMPAQVDVGNFVFELRDFKETFSNLLRGIAAMKGFDLEKWLQNRHLVIDALAIDPWKLSKLLTSLTLEWNLNWKPLWGDLKKLFHYQQAIGARLQLIRDAVKLGHVTIHSKRVLDPVPNVGTLEFEGLYFEGQYSVAMREWFDTRYRATGSGSTLKYDWVSHPVELHLSARMSAVLAPGVLPMLESIEVQTQALAASFSLGNPILSIWASLPWSFVVDYFVNVSRLLSRASIWAPEFATINIYDVCYSYRSQVEYVTRDEYHLLSLSSPPAQRFAAVAKCYVRRINLPDFTTSLVGPHLTPHQLMILELLLAATILL